MSKEVLKVVKYYKNNNANGRIKRDVVAVVREVKTLFICPKCKAMICPERLCVSCNILPNRVFVEVEK
jgi:ribosomal protein L32